MTKIGVIHIITRLDLGGAQRSCLELVKELQKKSEVEAYLISGTQGPLVPDAKKLKNVYLLDTMIWSINPKNLIIEIKNFIAIIKIIKKLKQKHPNLIVHTHTIKAGIIGRWAALFTGVKQRFHTIHGFSFHPYQNKLVWLLFYLTELVTSLITSRFICVSSQDLKTGCEIFPFFKNKSSIIRAATITRPPVKLLFKPSKAANTITMGTIASLKTGKNLFELIKAIKYAKCHLYKIELQIAGDGPLRPQLEHYIAKHHLQKHITLLGWQQNPIKSAKNWDLFIFTSLWEGLPCAVVEIANLGIPIVSYDTGGICDLIDKSKLYPQGAWVNLINKALINKKHPEMVLRSPLKDEFYIPKSALDHAKLYLNTTPLTD